MLRLALALSLAATGCVIAPERHVTAGSSGQPTSPIDRSAIAVGPSLEMPDEYTPLTLPVPFTASIETERWDVSPDGAKFVLYKDGVEIGSLHTHKKPQGTRISAEATAKEPGVYRVEVRLGNEVLGSAGFSIAHVPSIGGGVMLFAGGDGHASLRFKPGSDHVLLELRRWETTYESHAYDVEWSHDGKVAFTDRGRSVGLDDWVHQLEDRIGDRATFADQHLHGLLYTSRESYDMPRAILRQPGAWEVAVMRDDHPAFAAKFTVTTNGTIDGAAPVRLDGDLWSQLVLAPIPITHEAEREAALKALPPWKHALVAEAHQNLLPVTPMEIRALVRSQELWDLRRAFNDLIMPHGAAQIVLTADDRQRLTLDQQQRLVRRAQAEADTGAAAETRANRRAATKEIGRLKQLIRQHGGPFTAGEVPE